MYFPTNYKKELNDIKQYREYMGIIRKEFPKWQGWELIDSYKSKNIKVQDIDDRVLDVLVDCFIFSSTSTLKDFSTAHKVKYLLTQKKKFLM